MIQSVARHTSWGLISTIIVWCNECFCIRLGIHWEFALECAGPDLIYLPVPHMSAWHSAA
jgi:hypothetical protein